MNRIILINMPFAALSSPSIALTQLESVLRNQIGDRVEIEILYLNQDFARYFGIELYQYVVDSLDANNSGLGDWVFRQAAFPESADNTDVYFRRYFPRRSEQIQTLRAAILEKRSGMNGFLLDLIDEYRIDQAAIVGFTSMFAQNVACFAMAKKLKERNPNVTIAMGGANCESPMGEEIVTHVEQVDFVFSGPSLKSFPEFVQHYINGDLGQCHRINGVFSKANCSAGAPGGPGHIGEELSIDEPVPLDYKNFIHVFEQNFPNGGFEPILLFETSRGCWWGERAHCTFCGLNGMTMQYRAMAPQLAIEQIQSLFERYSSRCSHFECVDNIMPQSYPKQVFPFLRPPPHVSIFYEVKADLNEQELETLARARVKNIQPGIESLATSTLKLMKKGTTVFQNLSLLKNCVVHDIFPRWNLLVGFPGEGEEVYKKYVEDIPLLTHLWPPSGVFPVRFDRYSPYFVRAKQYGLDLHPYDFYNLVYPFGEEVLANMAYYFKDHNINTDYFQVMVKWLGSIREKVEAWRTRWLGDSKASPPLLVFNNTGNRMIVYDSRGTAAVEHLMSNLGVAVLELLTKPGKVMDLAAHFKSIPDHELEKELAWLQERGLVFQEGDRFMSLVLPQGTRTEHESRELYPGGIGTS
ncbi:MAG TPA: RiPP maturation radical SAM C-methyltransferase [Candidatus Binatia bacterium]|jgi:magnesium-protoporphyrin IX monomethyl ester (oxidative) cyclase